MTAEQIEQTQQLTVEEKLQFLYELQQVDTQKDKIRTLRGELPLAVQDLEDEIAGLDTRIENLNQDIKDAEQNVTNLGVKIKESQELIAKYSEQINNVRNNREYDALTKEIEFQNLEIELANKHIRESQKIKADRETNLEINNQLYSEKKIDLEVKRAELDDIINETHKDEEALSEKFVELSKKIDERLLSAYQRILSNARNGLAVAVVDRDACGGCFNKIPPQRQLDIRSRKKVIVCEYCGRILIDKYICDYDGSQQKADLELALEQQKKRSRRVRKVSEE